MRGVSVQLDELTKDFILRESRSVKDSLLGVAGYRPRKRRLRAVDSVSMSIEAGESVALTGPNGSGKSTTLKMLAGVMTPTSGLIRARGRIVSMLELGSGFHPDLTGRENIFLNGALLGIRRKRLIKEFDRIVSFAGIEEFLEVPVKFYSSGMASRLSFSVAAHAEPDILLVDEVLAVGDSDFKVKSLNRMKQFVSDGTTVILVTHDQHLVEQFATRLVRLESGRIVEDRRLQG